MPGSHRWPDRVATVEDSEPGEELVAHRKPDEPVDVAASEVSQHPCVAWVGLGRPGIKIRSAAHLQPGHVRDRHTAATSDRQQQLCARRRLVNHKRYRTMPRSRVD